MKNGVRLTKQQYAAIYDEQAGSFYRFALCVTGDKKQTEDAMARLFCEGYPVEEHDGFSEHMIKVLRRILESCPPDAEGYRRNIKSLLPDRKHQKLIGLLCGLTMDQRAELLQKLQAAVLPTGAKSLSSLVGFR